LRQIPKSDDTKFRGPNMRIAIIGANGYVGVALSSQLKSKKMHVMRISGSEFRKQLPHVREMFKTADVVVNCAHPSFVTDNPLDNQIDYESLISDSLPSKALNIFLSSSAVYSASSDACEDSPTNSKSNYAISKLSIEKHYLSCISNPIVFRMGQVYTNKPKPLTFFSDLIEASRKNGKSKLRNGGSRLSILLDSTLCDAILRVTYSNIGRVFNISSGLNMTTAELASSLIGFPSSCDISFERFYEDGTWLNIERAKGSGLVTDVTNTSDIFFSRMRSQIQE